MNYCWHKFLFSCELLCFHLLLDDITRNRIPRSARTELEKACYAIPWSPPDHLPLSHDLWAECDSIAPPPIQHREGETLPLVQPSRSPVTAMPYKVLS